MKESEQARPSAKLEKELGRLKKLPAIPGKATIGMMGEFKKFPWTQDTIITAGRREDALKLYLELYVLVKEETLEL